MVFFYILLLILAIAAEILLATSLAWMPMLRQRARDHNFVRWIMILLLGSVPTAINFVLMVWITVGIQAAYYNTSGIDYESLGAFVTELRWRTFFFRADTICFTGIADVCAVVTREMQRALALPGIRQLYGLDGSRGIAAIVIFLIPSFLTAIFIHRITSPKT